MNKNKILAVEDDPGTRGFYRVLLEEAGYIVRIAPDATAGIICCCEFLPDILILDWDMPGGGGGRVFEKICTLLGYRLPVLFITGFPEKIGISRLRAKIGILKKPANIKTILSEVERLLWTL